MVLKDCIFSLLLCLKLQAGDDGADGGGASLYDSD